MPFDPFTASANRLAYYRAITGGRSGGLVPLSPHYVVEPSDELAYEASSREIERATQGAIQGTTVAPVPLVASSPPIPPTTNTTAAPLTPGATPETPLASGAQNWSVLIFPCALVLLALMAGKRSK